MKPDENTTLIVTPTGKPKQSECVNTMMIVSCILIIGGTVAGSGWVSGSCFNFFVNAMKELQCALVGADRQHGIFVKRDNLPGFFNSTEVACNYNDRNYYFNCSGDADRNSCDSASNVATPQCVKMGFEFAGGVALVMAFYLLVICAVASCRARRNADEEVAITLR